MGNLQPTHLLLIFFFRMCTSDLPNTTTIPAKESNPIIIKPLISKAQNGTLKKGTVHVLHKTLRKVDELDLMRVSIEIIDPDDFKNHQGTFLEATVSNGGDSFSLQLPVILPNLTLFSDGKVLDTLMPEDFGTSRMSKRSIPEKNLTQNLVITIQSKLHEDIDYIVHLKSLDKSNYELRFPSGSSVIKVPNQHTTFVKPVGFFLDAVEQNVKSLHITVTSDSDICASLITVPANESIYYRRADSERIDNRRTITFTRRADILFSEAEIAEFNKFRIYAFVHPEDSACFPKSTRKHLNENKKISFEFVKNESETYATPILLMIAFFVFPALPFFLFIGTKPIERPIFISERLINLSSDMEETLPVRVDDWEKSPERQEDSLSMHAELLRYPVAIILPFLMHVAFEFHKWTTSTMANRDEMCFHNHACARPFGEFRAWNNVVSNVGFAVYGLLFVAITMIRRRRISIRTGYGRHECSLLDVTIGVFMVLQALASATYHICPSDVAFQFDTPCIQVICGLLIVRQWKIRLETPPAAYSNILLVAIVTLNFMVSALSATTFVRYFLAIIHTVVVIGFCYAKKKTLDRNEHTPRNYASRAFTVLFSIANISFMMLYLASSIIHLNQITTYCFILNCVLYIGYYSSMKVICNERITKMAMLYGALAVSGWALAIFCFRQDDTDWTKSAAVSRSFNKPCLLFDFFGSHDLWHIFGACAGLFTFLFVSFVDDDLLNVPSSHVTLF